MYLEKISKIWKIILYKTDLLIKKEPILSDFFKKTILQHNSLCNALSYILSNKLSTSIFPTEKMFNMFKNIYLNNHVLLKCIVRDIEAIIDRDPAVNDYLTPFLYFKGFHALETYRISHYLWNVDKKSLSQYLQSRISSEFSVDIHPASRIGSGVILDHANGIVIGEGVHIEDDVSIFHSVTLGGTGKNLGKNRHPTIRKGVIIGTGAKVLGNIEIGLKAKIGAGAIVLKNVPAYVTVVGKEAKIINHLDNKTHYSEEKRSNISYLNSFQNGDGI
ncbi:serine O-acetyltransferase [Buchnera aphidicola (Macrosiphoniella sanborni)]|uniref:Serine acetyltransferase n=1 Tax=Buchnera aphidicola (Macrosiphoniella sanborni) TaxID=1241865 RepID=A0A4D6YCB5_9GAMM|nr:serine O-acetyltransferase [Buchnera aphidicola]QCI23624.1 serine O-acetyltransferase [Buchnera aphidicola (Macrosiphoniella sanborni)]